MQGIGAFTIVNGMSMAFATKYSGGLTPGNEFATGLPDTEGRIVRGHGWNGGYVITLMTDPPGEEETAIEPSPGNG
jgi:hypothetical protein